VPQRLPLLLQRTNKFFNTHRWCGSRTFNCQPPQQLSLMHISALCPCDTSNAVSATAAAAAAAHKHILQRVPLV
jgi:hypothetical protein